MILRTVADINVEIWMLYMDHARKLKLSSYVNLPSTNKMFNNIVMLE